MEWLLIWPALCFVVAWAAVQKGRSGVGFFFLSLFLSPLIGLLVALVVPSRTAAAAGAPRPVATNDLVFCHQCRLPRRADSVSCPHCRAGRPDSMADLKKCPMCAETIKRDALKCRYCGADQPAAAPVANTAASLPAGAGGMGYCPGCGKLRGMNVGICSYCKDTRPTTTGAPLPRLAAAAASITPPAKTMSASDAPPEVAAPAHSVSAGGAPAASAPQPVLRKGALPYVLAGVGLVVLVGYLAGQEKAQAPGPTSSSSLVADLTPPATTGDKEKSAAPSSLAPDRSLTPDEIREIQTLLKGLGFDAGAADGLVGPATLAAVKRYQETRGWTVTGVVDRWLLDFLRGNRIPETRPATAAAPPSSAPPAETPRPVNTTSADVSLATRVIREADHPCPTVLTAVKLSDGSLRAACSNGEIYRIMSLRGQWVAMKCSAAQRLGVDGC